MQDFKMDFKRWSDEHDTKTGLFVIDGQTNECPWLDPKEYWLTDRYKYKWSAENLDDDQYYDIVEDTETLAYFYTLIV